MNAGIEVERMLEQSGAVLARQNKHLVYRLPNGRTFTRHKTPSDHRAALNELSDLRRALGVVRGKPKPRKAAPIVAVPEQPQSSQAQPKEVLKDRIAAAIAVEEAIQETLLAEAQAHERTVHMLKALLPFADDPKMEDSLRGVLPAPETPEPAPAIAAPPEAITERVQVTRQLVLAATQTFDDQFTVNDVMALMTNGRQIDSQERTRIRSSIAQCMIALFERGEIVKEREHFGRRQTIWRKAALNGNGHRSRVD